MARSAQHEVPVCALHELSTPCRKLNKYFKITNIYQMSNKLGEFIFPEGENPLCAGVTTRNISKSQGGLL